MAKSNAKKKSKPSPTPVKRPRAKAKPVKSEPGYYLIVESLAVELTNQKPAAGAVREFATFEDARSAAMDSLVEAIEAAESRLLAIKRAKTLRESRKTAAS